ncbi:Cysteine dioxygenase [Halocaridina rubra]|uniref:Cysteine dioxygenase n=1 Tax=Halocaridina rubra TaxID=373956 RepID=A0AAN8ZZW3_HALRR
MINHSVSIHLFPTCIVPSYTPDPILDRTSCTFSIHLILGLSLVQISGKPTLRERDSLGLHRVENVSHSDGAVSLHLYCPPFNSCSIFDERTGKKTKCPVTFWSKFGQKVDSKTYIC